MNVQSLMANKIRVGDEAPDFTLISASGQKISLKDYIDKKNIVLYFYPKDNTPGCIREACGFRDNYEVFKGMGAEVIGVSSDSLEKHQGFVKKHNLPFILLSDEKKKVRKKFGVPSTLGLIDGRVTYIIDKKGDVRHIFSSQFQPTKHIDKAIDVLKKLVT
jgi:peroxiredoxin Q/BCP|tara:strand:- start:347 stop:829 length:483 start_codon:yes stop_codon:yes gene_type:complete